MSGLSGVSFLKVGRGAIGFSMCPEINYPSPSPHQFTKAQFSLGERKASITELCGTIKSRENMLPNSYILGTPFVLTKTQLASKITKNRVM